MASLLPNGKQHFDDNNGRPLVGGRVYYYIPNTSTPKDTWQDEAMTTLNTNPIVLDARGECTAWGYGSYRQVVRDQFGNLIWDRLVTDFTQKIDAAIADLTEEFSQPDGSDMIGFLQAGDGAIPRTAQDKMREWVSVVDFGAKGDGVNDDTVSIRAAIATGKSVLFPQPTSYYNITDEIGPKFAGQYLFSNAKLRGMVRNTTNGNPLVVFGSASGPTPQAGVVGIGFQGNDATTGGIRLDSPNSVPSYGWSDACKDCVLRDVAVDGVGSGWALEVYSWCNSISNFTAYEGNQKGALFDIDHNQNTTDGMYLTGCDDVSLQLGGNGTRIGRGNNFNGLVVQQSGGANGCIVIGDSQNTTIQGLYLEANNTKGAPRSINVQSTAVSTVFTGVSHLSGGLNVLQNDGLGTVVNGICSSNVTGSIVSNVNAGVMVAFNIEWMPGVVPSGVKFADSSTAKNALHMEGATLGDFTVSSFAPIVTFNDQSAAVPKTRLRYDQSVYRLEYDAAGDGTFSTLLWAFNATVPEMIVDGTLRPNTDNNRTNGTGSRRWSVIYAGTGTINTSDEREKTDIGPVPDEVLDAWGDVKFVQYRWRDAVTLKGSEARHHVGVIAQQIRDAFVNRGLDATRYGLLCYDEWQDEFEPVYSVRLVEDDAGSRYEKFDTGERVLVVNAGDRWGIRPDECLFMEAAYVRRLVEAK